MRKHLLRERRAVRQVPAHDPVALDPVGHRGRRLVPDQLEARPPGLEDAVRCGSGVRFHGPHSGKHGALPGTLPVFSKSSAPRSPSLRAMDNNGYSRINFHDIDDMNARYGLAEVGEARYLREEVGAETIGVSLYSMRPGKRTGFGHRHEQVEE